MDQQTLDRAHLIISDRPGITRGELTTALATPGNKGSDRTTARVIAWLRDKQRRITSEGRGHRAIVPACVPACVPTVLACQHRDLKDLASVPTVPTPGSKGLSSSVPFGTQTSLSANSKDKAYTVVQEKESRMKGEHQPTGNGLQTALYACASGPQAEAAAPQQADSTSSSYLLAGIQDVREDILSLLARSVEEMKSRNQSNGYLIGIGRRKSMAREPWRHLQYAADKLSNPQADIYDVLLAIQCLAHSGIVYQAQELPWDEIHAKYPAPPPRAIKPVLWPGPVEEDIDALAREYGYTKVVPPAPVESTPEPSAAVEEVTVDPEAAAAETIPEPVPIVEEPAAPPLRASLPEKIVWCIQHGVHDVMVFMTACDKDYGAVCRAVEKLEKQNIIHKVDGRWEMAAVALAEAVAETMPAPVAAPEPVPATLEERILAILASAGCRTRDEIIRDLGVYKWDAIRALNILTMQKKIIAFGCGIPSYRLAPKEVNV